MDLETQKQKFQKNREQYKNLLGTQTVEKSPDFLYFVQIPAPESLWPTLEARQKKLKDFGWKESGFYVLKEDFHITLALPGRCGTHFQKNESGFMKKTLLDIISDFSAFTLQLGDFNVFANAIFCEIYDPGQNIFLLHKRICQEIPFSQNPEYRLENFLPHVSLFYITKISTASLQIPEKISTPEPEEFFVEKLVFGRARDEETGLYKKEILAEFNF